MEENRRQQEQAKFVKAVLSALEDDEATSQRYKDGRLTPLEVAGIAAEIWWGRTSEREGHLVNILKAQNFLLKIMIGDLDEEEVEGG